VRAPGAIFLIILLASLPYTPSVVLSHSDVESLGHSWVRTAEPPMTGAVERLFLSEGRAAAHPFSLHGWQGARAYGIWATV